MIVYLCKNEVPFLVQSVNVWENISQCETLETVKNI